MSIKEVPLTNIGLLIGPNLEIKNTFYPNSLKEKLSSLRGRPWSEEINNFIPEKKEIVEKYIEALKEFFSGKLDQISLIKKIEEKEFGNFKPNSIPHYGVWQMIHTPIIDGKGVVSAVSILMVNTQVISNLRNTLEQKNDIDREISIINKEILVGDKILISEFIELSFKLCQDTKTKLINSRARAEVIPEAISNLKTMEEWGEVLDFSMFKNFFKEEKENLDEIESSYKIKKDITEEQRTRLFSITSSVILINSKYSRQAANYLDVKDQFFLENSADIHRLTNKLMVTVHLAIHSIGQESQDDAFFSKTTKEILGFLETIDTVLLEFENVAMSTIVKELISYVNSNQLVTDRKISQEFLLKLENYEKIASGFFEQGPFGNNFSFENCDWLKIIFDLLEISKTEVQIEKARNKYELATELKSFLQLNNFFFLERIVSSISQELKKNGDSDRLKYFIKLSWNFILVIIYKDLSKNLPLGIRKELVQELTISYGNDEKLDALVEKFDGLECILLYILRFISMSGASINNFFEQIMSQVGISQFKDFVGMIIEYKTDLNKKSFEEMSKKISSFKNQNELNTYLDELMEKYGFTDNLKTVLNANPLKDGISHYFSRTELCRALESNASEISNTNETLKRSHLIPQYNILKLQECVREQSSLDPNAFKKIDYYLKNLNLIPLVLQIEEIKPKIVEMAKKYEKEVFLDLYGDDLYVDKKVTMELKNIFLLLIQNSLEHGIEDVEERKLKRKKTVGAIKLSLKKDGDKISIFYSDDGKGVDLGQLKKRAVEKGIIKRADSLNITNEELLDTLFKLGPSSDSKKIFPSIKDEGLTLVRTMLESMNGTIHASLLEGKGLRMHISLPIS